MFSLKDFIKNGLIKAVGNMADYQIILNAASWHEKGVLLESDLADIQKAIDEKNTIIEEGTNESAETEPIETTIEASIVEEDIKAEGGH